MDDHRKKQRIFKGVLTTVLLLTFFFLLSPFFIPILMAAIFALTLEPVASRMLKSRNSFLAKKKTVVLFLSLFLTAGLSAILFFLLQAYSEITQITSERVESNELYRLVVREKSRVLQSIDAWIDKMHLHPTLSAEQLLSKTMNDLVKFSGQIMTVMMRALPHFLLSLIVFAVSLFFFVIESDRIKNVVASLKVLSARDLNLIIKTLKYSSSVTILSTFVIALLQASLYTISSLVCGVGSPAVVFEVSFLMSFIPIIGTIPVGTVLIGTTLLEQRWLASVVLMFTAIVVGGTDAVVKSIWISRGNQNKVPPTILLLSLLGAVYTFGAPGLFLGPVLAGIIIRVLPAFLKLKVEAQKKNTKPHQKSGRKSDSDSLLVH